LRPLVPFGIGERVVKQLTEFDRWFTEISNKQLLDPTLDLQSVGVAELLARWNRLHAVRTVLSAVAFALLLRCLAGFHGKAL